MATRLDHLLIILDFDGTITEDDCNEVVLQQMVGDAWRESEDAMIRGEISHTEAFRRQMALLHVPRTELLQAAVAAARLRQGFSTFLTDAVATGARVAVVSDGLRETIEAVWRRERLPKVGIHASELLGDGSGGYEVSFDPFRTSCERCDHCKASTLRQLRNGSDKVAVFGDGDGDFCLAREAHLVFARRRLAELCQAAHIPYVPYDSFAHALPLLEALV